MGVRAVYCTAVPLTRLSLFLVSVTHGQQWSENIKWIVPEINNPYVFNCSAILSVMISHTVLLHPIRLGRGSSVCPACPLCVCSLPVSHLAATELSERLLWYCGTCSQFTLVLLNNSSNGESSDAGYSDMPKRRYKVLPLSEKVYMYRENHRTYIGSVPSAVAGIHRGS